MNAVIARSIDHGEHLADEELVAAQRHYAETAALLVVLGPKFALAFGECARRAEELSGYVRHRGLEP